MKRVIYVLFTGVVCLCSVGVGALQAQFVTEFTSGNTGVFDQFGGAVSVDGNRAVVGAVGAGVSGSATIFELRNDVWVETQRLIPSTGGANTQFGSDVVVSGNTIMVGAPGDDTAGNNAGAVYVFTLSGDTWTETAKLVPSSLGAGDQFGVDLDLDGDLAVVGAPTSSVGGTAAGSAYIFRTDGSNWDEEIQFFGSFDERLGWSVAVAGGTVAVGAPTLDAGGTNAGGVYIYDFDGVEWVESQLLQGDNTNAADQFGADTDMIAGKLIVGASLKEGGGRAYVFDSDGGIWSQTAILQAPGLVPGDKFGAAVAISERRAVVGAPEATTDGVKGGAVHVFAVFDNTWPHIGSVDPGTIQVADGYGTTVAVSDEWGMAGAPKSNAVSENSGAAYSIYVLIPSPPVLLAPANGAEGVTTTPEMSWEQALGAERYLLELSTSETFASLVEKRVVDGTSYTLGQVLENGQTHYWKLRALNQLSFQSGESETWNFTTIGGGATKVALESPADGSTGTSLSPTLAWQAVQGASSYHLQVATDEQFTALVKNQETVIETQYQLDGLDPNVTYHWRVKASNAGPNNWSDTWSFATSAGKPEAITLLLPADGTLNVPVSTTFTWNSDVEAETYKIQLSTVTDFSTTLVDTTGVQATELALADLPYGEVLFWRARGVNSLGEGPWSSVSGFITVRGGPTQVATLTPEIGSTGIELEPLLVWEQVEGADTYWLQLSLSLNFTSIVLEQRQLTDTTFQAPELLPDTTYYWRVKASNAGSVNFSATASFATGSGVPAKVVLESPLDDAVDVSVNPVLLWTVPARGASFNLQISLDSTFTNLIVSETGLDDVVFQVFGLNPMTTFYWRAQAVNKEGVGPWSDVWSFSTLNVTAPSAPALISPLNGEVNVPTNPLFTWNAVATATSYRLEISTNPTFSTVALAVVVSETQFRAQGFTPMQGYFWRVEARNAGGSAVSPTWGFTTGATPTAAEDEEIPEDFALGQNYPNPFNPSTRIEFSLPEAADVRLAVFDIRGIEVARLVDKSMAAGRHTVTWNARDLPSGTYLYKIEAGDYASVRKLVLTK